MQVLVERQSEDNRDVILPGSKDPMVTARWIERCVAGSEPVPQSLKIQLACCLLATGEVENLEAGLARVAECW
ncbi:putative anthranilate phosphoribosyltransferase [Trabulsiella guamensis ATCC 49490]|uniref:Putative anthranilate phosphoribosyltransferase n=1 Tax=Trabulsiella guamensis ATCC 49490 TaxID=1005994 RepID=A0A084ZX10_9ENTR|nr:putative anthranilate phosphoribosyltransferase [Trabulsiella guamensis ATCC 49490]